MEVREHYHCRLQTRQQEESLRTGKECECEELRFKRGSPLACAVMHALVTRVRKRAG